MLIEVETTTDRCDFENCIHYEEGRCRDKSAHEDCIEFAFAVLCANKGEEDG